VSRKEKKIIWRFPVKIEKLVKKVFCEFLGEKSGSASCSPIYSANKFYSFKLKNLKALRSLSKPESNTLNKKIKKLKTIWTEMHFVAFLQTYMIYKFYQKLAKAKVTFKRHKPTFTRS